MPWVTPSKDDAPAPIMPTGETPPNPFRTWEHDLIDALPVIAGLLAVALVFVAVRHYGPVWWRLARRIVHHLRTPVT